MPETQAVASTDFTNGKSPRNRLQTQIDLTVTDPLEKLTQTLQIHKEKFQRWQSDVTQWNRIADEGYEVPLSAMSNNDGIKSSPTMVDSARGQGRARGGKQSPQGKKISGLKNPGSQDQQLMNDSMKHLIRTLEKSARGALQQFPQTSVLDTYAPMEDEDDGKGSMDGSDDGADVAEDSLDMAAKIEAELAKVCEEAEALAEAVQTGPLHMPDGFLSNLEYLFRQNAVLKESQEKYAAENAKLRNESRTYRTRLDKLQEEYTDVIRAHNQKIRSYNYLQTLFDKQNISADKTAYVREIALLRAQNAELKEKVSSLTDALDTHRLQTDHILDEKTKEYTALAKECEQAKAQLARHATDTGRDSIDELFSGSEASSQNASLLDLVG